MKVRRGCAVLLLIAAGCGGDADAGPAPGDYSEQLQRVSETAHIQERGLRRDLRRRLEDADPGADRMAVVTVFIDQSVRLAQDVMGALRRLDPPPELVGPQQDYLEAWQARLDLMITIRDAGFPGPRQILEAIEAPVFADAAAETRARCEDLQAAMQESGSPVDLVCDGRPA